MSHDARPLVQPFHNLGVQDSAELQVAIIKKKFRMPSKCWSEAEKAAWSAVQQQINAEKERKSLDGCEGNDNLPRSRRPLGAWDDPKTKTPASES